MTIAAAASIPQPRREETLLEHAGDVRVDEYFWLRNREDPAVLEHLEAENAYQEAAMAPHAALREKLYEEILGHIKQTDLSVPYRMGAFRYYSRTVEGEQYPVYARVPLAASVPDDGTISPDEEVLLDGNVLALGTPFFSVGSMTVSDDGGKLAYTTDTTGYRQYTLFVKDLRSGALLDLRVERVDDVVWAAGDTTIFYVTEDAVSKRADRLWRHDIAEPAGTLVYEETDDEFQIGIERSRDRAYVFCVSVAKDTSETRYLLAANPTAGFELFHARRDGHRYFVDHRGDRFYVRTDDRGALDFAIASLPDTDPLGEWHIVVPETPGETIESIDCFARFAVVSGRRDGLRSLAFYDYDTHVVSPLVFDQDDYVAALGANPEFDADEVRISFQSMLTPPSVYDIDVRGAAPARGARTLRKRTEVPGFDPSRYVAERVWATAADGTRVPISLVAKHRGDDTNLLRDGWAPVLLYGYGSYGISIEPTFSPARLALLDRGVVFAIAHVRGGGELGEGWRVAGNLRRKRTTFEDFIACADHLAAHGIADPKRIAIQGGSAGGLLLGAVLNIEPERFCGALVQVPFVDVVTTMLDADLPLTTGEYREWGNPNDPEAYAYIKSYSPYDNIAPQSYPPVLVEVSLNDSQVPYWEGAKYAARLRDRSTSGNPVLLKANLAAGHGGASGRYDYLKDVAFEYAFLLHCFGIAGA